MGHAMYASWMSDAVADAENSTNAHADLNATAHLANHSALIVAVIELRVQEILEVGVASG